MNNYDGDMEYLNDLAGKYKKKSITKKDLYQLGVVMLLLGGVSIYSTVNALTLKITNIQLENTIAQYAKPVSSQSLVNELPKPFSLQGVSFDFEKTLPQLNVSYLNVENKICNTSNLELPPTIELESKSCISNNNIISFGNGRYTVNSQEI